MLPSDILAVKTSAASVLPLGKKRLIRSPSSQTPKLAHNPQSMSKPKEIWQKRMLCSPAVWQWGLQTPMNISNLLQMGDVSTGVSQVHELQLFLRHLMI